MDPSPPEFNPQSIETEVLALWKSRRLPPAGGVLGPPAGPTVRQFEGSWTQGDFPALVAHRAVMADVDARYLALAGRRVSGTLRQGPAVGKASASTIPALLTALGVWTGGDGRAPWDTQDRTARVQAIVGRLAWKEILVTRDESFRVCPTCGTLRSPERIVYDQQEGDTYLVRFPVRIGDWTVHALVWVDAPWKLLGASALLLNPNLPYVVAGYRRREDHELILTSASSIERLRSWLPESVLEVVEEKPGREFHGIPYAYPLRHEFPMGGDLSPPAGTLLSTVDVGDSGTGIVPLVPGHGPTDARIADRLGVTGWPLLTPKGRLDYTLMHKYAGLDLETANEFVLRDLSEAGALLALLRVKRGVPYCSVCGTPLLWAPARAWCLEPSRLPAERRATFSRLLPNEALPGQAEVAPWPVSEATPSEDPGAVTLLECARCDRLEAPEGTKECPCGGQRTLVRRKLLPSISAALGAWARCDPFLEGDSAHLYVGRRRRVPSLVHHLAAISGIEGTVGDVSLTVVPTVAADDVSELVRTYGGDAARAAIVRSGLSESAGGRFTDQCRRESDRIRRWWSFSREVVAHCDASMIAAFARPIGGFLGELEVEDRAVVARWERTRVLALDHYDHGAPGLVHRRVARFIDNDLGDYKELIRPRLAAAGAPPTKRAALRTLVHLLRGISEVLAPIVPFTAESVHRSLAPERTSLFEQPMAGLDRTLLNDDLVAAWDRWHSVLRSVDRLRRSKGIARTTVVPELVLVTNADDLGDRLRAEKDLLGRLARVRRIEVGSPREPWPGRQRVLRPVEAEIQKVYPTRVAQIVHILQRMGPRRGATPTGEEELSVVVDGYPVRVFPSMFSYEETLPARVVPVPWSLGEMYVELPGSDVSGRRSMPPLSSDAYWLVRRVERRLRNAPAAPGGPPRVALVTVKDPLASELRSSSAAVARYLGLGELRVVEKAEEAVPPNAMTGRTRTGDRWWVHVPGLPPPPSRAKRARSPSRLQRVASPVPGEAPPEVDYADEKVVAREEAVRALGQVLDDLVGIPLLGPSKVAGVWDHGLHSVDDLRQAPFEVVSALPGFGGPVAEVVLSKLGGTVPTRGHRPAPRPRPATVALRPPPPVSPAGSTPPSISPTGSTVLPEVSIEAAPSAPAPSSPETPVPPTSQGSEPLVEEPSAWAVPPRAPSVPTDLHEEAVTPPTETPPVEAVPEPPAPAHAAPAEATENATPPMAVPSPPVESTPSPAPKEVLVEPSSEVEAHAAPAENTEATVPPPAEAPTTDRSESPSVSDTIVPVPPEIPSAVLEVNLPPVAPPSEEVPAQPDVVEPEIAEPEPLPAPEMESGATLPSPPVTVPETSSLDESAPGNVLPPMESLPTPAPPVDEGVAPPSEPPLVAPLLAEPVEEPTPIVAEPPPTEPEEPAAPSSELAATEPIPPSSSVTLGAPEEKGEEEPAPPLPPSDLAVETPAPPPNPEPPPTVLPPPVSSEPVPANPPPPLAPPVAVPIAPLAAPEPPAVVPAVSSTLEPPPPPAPPTGVELAVGDSLVAALSGFLDATAAGHRGVCVVRESPERIRARVGSRPIEVYWLSNIGRGPSLRPADLDGLWALLSRKLVDDHATAFFFEGIEYLVRIHGVDAVTTGLVQFDRIARENDARVWIYLNPALMKESDIDRFRSTFERSPPVG